MINEEEESNILSIVKIMSEHVRSIPMNDLVNISGINRKDISIALLVQINNKNLIQQDNDLYKLTATGHCVAFNDSNKKLIKQTMSRFVLSGNLK